MQKFPIPVNQEFNIEMAPLRTLYPDGSERQVNPFTGMEVWYIPGRRDRPILTANSLTAEPIVPADPENYCSFCCGRYFETTPEKSRISREGKRLSDLEPEITLAEPALFRCIPNLYPIITFDYWRYKYQFELSAGRRRRMEQYIQSPQGLEHLRHLIQIKQKDKAGNPSREFLLAAAAPFFGSSHELIIALRHFQENATNSAQLFSPGSMSSQDHAIYFQFTLDAAKDIYLDNPHVKYVSVYQNWLSEAGASFVHLHRQLLGLDVWGEFLTRKIKLESNEPGIFNRLALNWAIDNDLIVCENEGAVACVEIGQPFPTIAVYSKLAASRLEELDQPAVKFMSDVVHAIHAAGGVLTPSNEEWFLTPPDTATAIPWHILIKWRINKTAGFEGSSNIFLNPYAPESLRDQVRSSLGHLAKAGQIDDMNWSPPFDVRKDDLRYSKKQPK